jgi:hypothetical protein
MGTSPRVRIGSVKFSFLSGATAPATLNTETLYLTKFPECSADWDPKVKTVDVMQPYLGVNQLIKSPVVQALPEYTLTLKSMNDNVTALFFGSANALATDTEPTTITLGSGWLVSGWGYMAWYENGDAAGTPYRVHAGFQCQLVPSGNLSRDPEKPQEAKILVRLISAGSIYSATGA